MIRIFKDVQRSSMRLEIGMEIGDLGSLGEDTRTRRDASGGQTGNIRTQLWYYYGKWVSLRFARLRGFIFWLAVAPLKSSSVVCMFVGVKRRLQTTMSIRCPRLQR